MAAEGDNRNAHQGECAEYMVGYVGLSGGFHVFIHIDGAAIQLYCRSSNYFQISFICAGYALFACWVGADMF